MCVCVCVCVWNIYIYIYIYIYWRVFIYLRVYVCDFYSTLDVLLFQDLIFRFAEKLTAVFDANLFNHFNQGRKLNPLT